MAMGVADAVIPAHRAEITAALLLQNPAQNPKEEMAIKHQNALLPVITHAAKSIPRHNVGWAAMPNLPMRPIKLNVK